MTAAASYQPGVPLQAPIDTGEKAPNKRAPRARTAPSRARATPARSLKTQIAGLLMTLNLALYLIPPARGDVLDEVEIEALARALDEQAKRSQRFRKMLETALATTSGGALLGVCAIIGARRAARHGMLPAKTDQQLGNLLAMGLNQPVTPEASDVGAN